VLLQPPGIISAAILRHPRVTEYFIQAWALAWILVQQPTNQVFGLSGDLRRKYRRASLDLLIRTLLAAVLERWFSHQELVQQDPETPYVDGVVVTDLLWWTISGGK
jgi:hypothetical protein